MGTEFHKYAGFALLLIHSLFLIRSAYLIKTKAAPSRGDQILMFLSQILLALVIISGVIRIKQASFVHGVIGFMPLVMMFVFSRKSFRRKNPLLLPLFNALWILAAVLTASIL